MAWPSLAFKPEFLSFMAAWRDRNLQRLLAPFSIDDDLDDLAVLQFFREQWGVIGDIQVIVMERWWGVVGFFTS